MVSLNNKATRFEHKKKQNIIPYVEPKIAYFYFKGSGIEIFQHSNVVSAASIGECSELGRNGSPFIGYNKLYLNGWVGQYDFDFSKAYSLDQSSSLRRGLRRIKLINEVV